MASKIKFIGTGDGSHDCGVHFVGLENDYTLCGCSLDDDPLTFGKSISTKEKVNCQECINIIVFSKSVKRTEYE